MEKVAEFYKVSYEQFKKDYIELNKDKPCDEATIKEIYDNIIFIIPPTTYEEVYKALGEPKQELEKIKEYKNNIFWSYNLKDYRKTNWCIYNHCTIW